MNTRQIIPAALLALAMLPATARAQDACDGLKGAAFGLCTAYCDAMDCASPDHTASDTACAQVEQNYAKVTNGGVPPCLVPPSVCTDSDGGYVYDVAGVVSVVGQPDRVDSCWIYVGDTTEKVDSCSGEGCRVEEFACGDLNGQNTDTAYVDFEYCPCGCAEGACPNYYSCD